MRPHLPVVLTALLALAPAAAHAQATAPAAASAQPASATRGPLAVLGLRAPDGDADMATSLTAAFRAAARDAGFQVPDDTPSFDQVFAMVGCATTEPDCLALVSADVHAQRFLYGAVQRVGRGRDAPLSVEVSLWDNAARREVHREADTVTRAQMADRPEVLQEVARRMFAVVLQRDDAARAAASQSAQRQTPASAQPDPRVAPPPAASRPSPLLRWVGFGLLGAGVVVGGIGVWQWANTSGLSGDSQNGTGEHGPGWVRYDNAINPPGPGGARMLTTDQVCDRARGDTANPDAASAARLCDAHGSAQTLAIALGVTGLALAGAGAALVVYDAMRGNTPSREGARARLQVSPVVGPRVGGVHLGLSF